MKVPILKIIGELYSVDIEKEISKLIKRISNLEQSNDQKDQRIKQLEQRVKDLEVENESLQEKLHKKNSTNSSLPPSKDENRVKPNQTLRKQKGKKSGGQQGHPGDFLKMTDVPDELIDHKPQYCKCCGKPLTGEMHFIAKRQVIDIPPITPIITEHRIYATKCECNHTTESDFPNEASAPVSYGDGIASLISYLSVRQYLSVKRIQEYLEQVMGLSISQGTIVNKLEQFADHCQPWYERIRQKIQKARVVGTDETGCVVNGEKHWMWTWQNEKLTFIAASHTRGYQAITDNFPDGLPNTILLSDCWAAQLKTQSRAKQICMAHLQRELNYFKELAKESWTTCFSQLINNALEVKAKWLSQPEHCCDSEIQFINQQCEQLLNQQIQGSKKLLAFKKRLSKNKHHLWTFLQHKDVPPDNNGAERAIRNVKIKQKISGQFKSENGAKNFAIIRSVIDTIIKNNQPVFDTLFQIPKFRPE